MKELDWEYMTGILEAATEGGTGCAPELFDGGKAWHALGQRLPPGWGEESLSAENQEKELETLIKFHTHTGAFADMGLIEIWDNQAMRNRYGHYGIFFAGEEYWPMRVTAKGHNYLSVVRADRSKGGKILDALAKVGYSVAQRAINAGHDKVVETLTSTT